MHAKNMSLDHGAKIFWTGIQIILMLVKYVHKALHVCLKQQLDSRGF
jgi:hypothetical protein